MSQTDQNLPTSSDSQAESFAAQLRTKAQEAIDASMHHAQLSQRYMDLSKRFAELAESAAESQLPELKAQARQLTADAAQIDTEQQTQPPALASSSETPNPVDVSVSNNDVTAGLASLDPPAPITKVGPDSAADSLPPTSPIRRKRIHTRTFVQRVRAAKLAAAKRIRVKARKEDLAPRERSATEELKKSRGSLASSILLCCGVLVLLSLLTVNIEAEDAPPVIMASFSAEEPTAEEESVPLEPPEEEVGEQQEEPVEEPVEEVVEPEPEPEETPEPEPEPEPIETPEPEMAEAEPMELPESLTGTEPATNEPAEAINPATVDNRSNSGRKMLLQKFGGSAASESAVGNALKWLVSVQSPEGWWDFDTVGPAGYPGTINNPIGGTAYALLPFLAAGNSHKEGPYKKNVQAGINFLTRVGINAPAGYDLRGMINKNSDDKEPNEAYYVHGAATLALCEAYGMTKDRRLKPVCEKAIRFIINSQDPRGGGWRYNPQDPGSTSVTAIQVMALMSAKKAGIKVNDNVFKGVMHYLDGVQVDGKGRYGYEAEKRTYKGSCTAMALLCRMYCGWQRDDGDMADGIALLDKAGPYDNLYSLYFATQVMKNWGGEEWERWNVRMRDDLIAQQETTGPSAGSWSPRTGAIHAKQGGRLLSTVLATLTLEVYYRYKPLLPEPTE